MKVPILTSTSEPSGMYTLEAKRTPKAREGDVVELTQDLPDYALRTGQRGRVVEVHREPGEAYDVEFEDEQGTFLGFAYSVRPSQISNLSRSLFERGITFHNQGRFADAERALREATSLTPTYISVLNNSIVSSFEGSDDWQRRVTAMRMVLRIDPTCQTARNNLAIAYLNYGIQEAVAGRSEGALQLFRQALGVGPSSDIASTIQHNLAAAYTSMGVTAYKAAGLKQLEGNDGGVENDLMTCLNSMVRACAHWQDETTRHNLGLAYGLLALFCLDVQRPHDSIYWFEMAEDTGLLLAAFLNDYGVALAATARLDDSILAFERALELAPGNEVVRSNLESLIERGAPGPLRTEEINEGFYPPTMTQPLAYLAA